MKVLLAAAAALCCTLMPAPPGNVVQSSSVALGGESAAARWRAVVSKSLVGSGNGQSFYQWYLSLYAMKRGALRLRYQSPGNGGPLSRVEQARGAKMWFPVQQLEIVGEAQLMRPGVEQLVVQSHEMAADCGSAAVTVFASKPGGSAGPAVTVSNPCELKAAVAPGGGALELTGPYYGANAPLCCPTKPKANATLRYRDGKWTESPNYFKIQ